MVLNGSPIGITPRMALTAQKPIPMKTATSKAVIRMSICFPFESELAWEVGFEPTIMVLETNALDQTKLHPYVVLEEGIGLDPK
jgi:hypothetical protein